MPGYILHLTEAKLICRELRRRNWILSQDWERRFSLGCLLPDTRIRAEKAASHFWNPAESGQLAMAPNLTIFEEKYGSRLEGPLMLGYWTHLCLDAWYVEEFWPRCWEFRNREGQPERMRAEVAEVWLKTYPGRIPKELFFSSAYYYGDYTRMNHALMERYQLQPPCMEEELICPMAEVCPADLMKVLEELERILRDSATAREEELRVFRLEDLVDFIEQSALRMADLLQVRLQQTQESRILALDLDGTFLRTDKTLSAVNKEALMRRINRGDLAVVASGRPYSALPENVMTIPGLSYAIASNGVAVYDCRRGERILHRILDRDRALQILEYIRRENLTAEVLVDGQAYAAADFVVNPQKYGVNEHGLEYIRSTRIPVEDPVEFALAHAEELEGINIMTPDSRLREKCLEDLSEIPDLYLTSSMPRLLELAAAGSGKEEALAWLAQREQIKRSRIYAFGNEENDLGMMRLAANGVAVGNSSPAVLQEADYITGDNDRDGVALFLEQILGGVERKTDN